MHTSTSSLARSTVLGSNGGSFPPAVRRSCFETVKDLVCVAPMAASPAPGHWARDWHLPPPIEAVPHCRAGRRWPAAMLLAVRRHTRAAAALVGADMETGWESKFRHSPACGASVALEQHQGRLQLACFYSIVAPETDEERTEERAACGMCEPMTLSSLIQLQPVASPPAGGSRGLLHEPSGRFMNHLAYILRTPYNIATQYPRPPGFNLATRHTRQDSRPDRW